MNAAERARVEEPDVIRRGRGREAGGRGSSSTGDSMLVFDPAETLVAYATLDGRTRRPLDLDAYVHPEHPGRGLGGFLLDWARGGGAPPRAPTVVTAFALGDRQRGGAAA